MYFLYFVNTKSKEILFIFGEYSINLTAAVRLQATKKPWPVDQGDEGAREVGGEVAVDGETIWGYTDRSEAQHTKDAQ